MKFFVPGVPMSKGNHIAFCPRRKEHHRGHATPCRPFVTEDTRSDRGKKVAAWERAVRVASRVVANSKPLTGPVKVTLNFFFPQPKCHAKEPFPLFAPGGDEDKIKRAVNDGLQAKCDGYILEDDKQIVRWGEGGMWWADERGPGVEIEVEALKPQQGSLL